jgi:hypothetical protein
MSCSLALTPSLLFQSNLTGFKSLMKAHAFEIGSMLALSLASDKDVIEVTLHLKAEIELLPNVISLLTVGDDVVAWYPITVTFS